jgi:DNA-binding winged helix-turn-helix (wHTH) protein
VSARFSAFMLDTVRRQLLRDGAEVHLTPKAFDLLARLIDGAPRVIPKSELHAALWPNAFVSDATLVRLVKEVRRVLGDREGKLVRTAHRHDRLRDQVVALKTLLRVNAAETCRLTIVRCRS